MSRINRIKEAARAVPAVLEAAVDFAESIEREAARRVDAQERELAEAALASRKIALVGRAEDEIQSDLPPAKARRLGANTGIVEFDVQPVVTESGSASYAAVDDIRQAASLLIYMGSPSREFTITSKFVSRTKKEAEANWRRVQILRSWRTPEAEGGGMNMKTPSRLTLTGLSGWFNQIPVRLTNLSIDEPDDVDYIKSYEGYDVPIVWPVTINLKEARSPNELSQFNIKAFRAGKLEEW